MKSGNPGIRLGLVCLAAASAGLSLVIISISKVLLVIAVLPALLLGKRPVVEGMPLQKMGAPLLATVVVFAFAASLLWTVAPMDQAQGSLGLWGVQLGIGGIVLLLAFLSAAVLDLRKMDTPVARAGQSVLLALVIACLFNSSLYDAFIGDFFCLALGLLLAYGARSLGEAQVKPQES